MINIVLHSHLVLLFVKARGGSAATAWRSPRTCGRPCGRARVTSSTRPSFSPSSSLSLKWFKKNDGICLFQILQLNKFSSMHIYMLAPKTISYYTYFIILTLFLNIAFKVESEPHYKSVNISIMYFCPLNLVCVYKTLWSKIYLKWT